MTESGGARSGGRVGDVFFLIFSGAMEEGGGVERGEGVDERTRQGAWSAPYRTIANLPPPLTSKTTTTTTTLTEETTWRLRLLLKDVTTTNGRKLDGGASLFVLEGKFVEEMGYEPPQGYFQPTTTTMRTAMMEEEGVVPASPRRTGGRRAGGGYGGTTTLEVVESRWKLSEDPDDPKDGLWI